MSYVPKVLIVDDDPRMCDSLKVLLGNNGYEVQARHNGQEALEALNRGAFDLVLLDFVLPDLSGAEIMDHVSSQSPEPFVIVITGHASWDSAVDSLKKGAFDYLRKPFEPEELSRAVKNALDRKALKSEQKRVEGALRESEEKYKTLAENSLTGIFIHQDGKYVFVNERFAQIHGYTPEELLGKDCLSLLHSEERDAFAHIAALRLKGEAVTPRYEVRRLGKDEKTIWCEMMATRIEYGGRPAIMGNIIDITERKSMAEALRASEELYSNILDSVSDGILAMDPNFHYTHWNRAMERIFKIPREEVVGVKKRPWELFPHLAEQGGAEMMRKSMRGEVVQREDIPYRLKDGTEGFTSEIFLPLRTPDGEIRGIVGVIRDITERKRSQEALAQSEKRMEMLEFANDVALKVMHELRNPLTSIGGFSALIASRDYPEDKLKEYTKLIFEESMRLNKAVNEVLDHLKNAAEHA